MKTMQAKWAEEKAAKKTVAGQAHMQVSVQDIEQQTYHQDDFEDVLACIQAEEDNA